jgi:hypothetical protein
MALTGNLTIQKDGIEEIYPQCYARIMVGTSTKYDTDAIVNFYATRSVRETQGEPVQQKQYFIENAGGVSWVEVYTYLKSLPEFAAWSDI